MAAYVYKYVHPEKGCIYVGRTKNLDVRIWSHDHNGADNISRDFETLLNDSDVYYCEVANTAESIIVETYLINTLKPKLNGALKYDGITSSIQVAIPEFILMDNERRCKRDINVKQRAQKRKEKRQEERKPKKHSIQYWIAQTDKDLKQWGGKRVPDQAALYVDMVSQLDNRCLNLYNYLVRVASLEHDGFARDGLWGNEYHITIKELCGLYGANINDRDEFTTFGEMLLNDLIELEKARWYAIGDGCSMGTHHLLRGDKYKPYGKNDIIGFSFDTRNSKYILEGMNAEPTQP